MRGRRSDLTKANLVGQRPFTTTKQKIDQNKHTQRDFDEKHLARVSQHVRQLFPRLLSHGLP